MKDLLRTMRRHKLLLVWPAIVFVVMLALAIYLATRPILGNAVYRP